MRPRGAVAAGADSVAFSAGADSPPPPPPTSLPTSCAPPAAQLACSPACSPPTRPTSPAEPSPLPHATWGEPLRSFIVTSHPATAFLGHGSSLGRLAALERA